MKKILLAAATVTIGLMSATPMVMAQTARPYDASQRDTCEPGQKSCAKPLEQGGQGKGPAARPDGKGPQHGPAGQQAHDQNGPGRKGHNQYAQNQQGQNQPGKKQQAQGNTQKSHAAPKIGASGRQGKPFQRTSDSRFAAPPKGQDYRVVNDHLVLVNKDTLKIVTVVGLLSTLLN